jgi:hypothetical protein
MNWTLRGVLVAGGLSLGCLGGVVLTGTPSQAAVLAQATATPTATPTPTSTPLAAAGWRRVDHPDGTRCYLQVTDYEPGSQSGMSCVTPP